MQKVTIQILQNKGPFTDTLRGSKYPAFIYEAGEIVPEPWSRPWDNGPEEFKVIALIDDKGDDVLQDFDATVDRFFVIVDEDVQAESVEAIIRSTQGTQIKMYTGIDEFDGSPSMFAVKVGTPEVAICFADGEHWMTPESFGNPDQWAYASRDLFPHLEKSLANAELVWEETV